MSAIAIFTDLDGTLIDFETYSPELAKPYVHRLVERGALVVFCSSKTFAEQLVLQRELGIEMPCIVENGSAIVAPEGFWKELPEGGKLVDGWVRIELGISSSEIKHRVGRIESLIGQSLMGFGSILAEDVARITGLDFLSAKRAQERDYSETLGKALPDEVWDELDLVFMKQGLKCLPGGRFHTVIGGQADKGAAIRQFVEVWQSQFGDTLETVGLGDSENDRELLANV
ncbi:MAG: HAD hydrolase family protein, partial [Verrucomicrobiota bacterium]